MLISWNVILTGPIDYKNRQYNLTQDLVVLIEVDRDFFHVTHKETKTYGYGESLTSALRCFEEMFDFQYQQCQKEDSELVKQFNTYIKSVEILEE